MLKPYNELVKLDISQYTEKRDDLDYLNWAKCIQLLHENGAEKVYFEPMVNDKGSSLFMTDAVFTDSKGNTNRCYEVGVKVFVDDNEWTFRGALMNGANPVKDNSLSQQRIWNCQTRLFVKCIAIHTGLGFSLWVKEEVNTPNYEDDLYKHDLFKIKERVEQLITKKLDAGRTMSEIAEHLNTDEAGLNAYMTYYKLLWRLENKIQEL